MIEPQKTSYGISKDAKIRTSSQQTTNRTISELYSMPERYRKQVKFRCVDESTGDLGYDCAESIIYTGVKTTYTIRTMHDYEMRATPETMFLTENGWRSLKDIKVGERIYINGQNAYKDRDWLYQKYIVENLTLKEIALLCGVTALCIYKWVGKFNLQKGINRQNTYKNKDWLYQKYIVENLPQREIALLCGVTDHCINEWVGKFNLQKNIEGQNTYMNKDWLYQKYIVENLTQNEIAQLCGITDKCIHYWVGKFNLQKEKSSWNRGRTKFDCPSIMNASILNWKAEGLTDRGLRARTAKEVSKTGVCEYCGFIGATHIHHINKNLKEYNTNVVELCVTCHNVVHHKEIKQRPVLSEVVSIEKYGDEDTYKIVMAGVHHNFVPEGFVVLDPQYDD